MESNGRSSMEHRFLSGPPQTLMVKGTSPIDIKNDNK